MSQGLGDWRDAQARHRWSSNLDAPSEALPGARRRAMPVGCIPILASNGADVRRRRCLAGVGVSLPAEGPFGHVLSGSCER